MSRPNVKYRQCHEPGRTTSNFIALAHITLDCGLGCRHHCHVEGGFTLLVYAWMFPYGLLALFTPKNWDPPVSKALILIMTWTLYVALTVVGLLQKRRVCYFIAFGILCMLLVLNVVGCHVMINQPINIGG
jgi:peptidoglycan/LPS O-acetylase OafA/YrhL